ncbi:MAG: cell envelope integrity protein CreD [Gammaproteobacteria bacterium]|nr:cell envelope integrity protein CreD [Gammaproteobacteria bacterium]
MEDSPTTQGFEAPPPGFFKRLRGARSVSLTGKLIFIGIIMYLLLGAISMVQVLVYEREHRAGQVGEEIGRLWGQAQTISGPVLAVPYGVAGELPGAEYAKVLGTAFFLPKTTQFDGDLEPEIRRRGLFETAVYTLSARVSGTFGKPDVSALVGLVDRPEETILLWDRATVVVGLTDLRGMRANVALRFGEESFAFRPGVTAFPMPTQGMSANVASYFERPDGAEDEGTIAFQFTLELNGSQRASFTPFADETAVNIRSSWPSPSFEGGFLPVEHEITDAGFDAKWRVSHFARGFPAVLTSERVDGELQTAMAHAGFGLSLYQPVTPYRKVHRAIKYGILFLVFTFGFYFLVEMVTRHPIHAIQYATVGIPLCLFFLLLVAFAEHVGFSMAYVTGTLSVMFLVGLYSYRMLRSFTRTLLITGLLGGMYAFLYSLLELESYSLLGGAIGLWVLTAVFMWVTRRINWYGNEGEAHAA